MNESKHNRKKSCLITVYTDIIKRPSVMSCCCTLFAATAAVNNALTNENANEQLIKLIPVLS